MCLSRLDAVVRQNPAAALGAMAAVDCTVTQDELSQLQDVVTHQGYRLVLCDVNKDAIDSLVDFVAETNPSKLVLRHCWTRDPKLLRRFLRAVDSMCDVKLCANTRQWEVPSLNPVWLKPLDRLTTLAISEYHFLHCDLTVLANLETLSLVNTGNQPKVKLPATLLDFTFVGCSCNRIEFAPGTQLKRLRLSCVRASKVVNVPPTTDLFSLDDSTVHTFEPPLSENVFLGAVEVNHNWVERVLPLCSKATRFTTDVGSSNLDLRALIPAGLPCLNLIRLTSDIISVVHLPGDNQHLKEMLVLGPIMLQSDGWAADTVLTQNKKLCSQVLAHNGKWAEMNKIELKYEE